MQTAESKANLDKYKPMGRGAQRRAAAREARLEQQELRSKEQWQIEAWRLNLQVKAGWGERKELADDKQCPDAVLSEFDQKLGKLLEAQEVMMGGVARRARGILRGSYQAPVGRDPSPDPRRPWLGEQIAAVQLFKLNGRKDYKPVLANRKERRTWAKLTPFRVKKQRIKTRDIVIPQQEGA